MLKKYKTIAIKGFFTANIIGFLLTVIIVFQVILFPGKVPSFLGFSQMFVATPSMSPTLMPGDLIVVKAVKPGKLKKGDIITYKVKGTILVTHRIIDVLPGDKRGFLYQTQGDANSRPDTGLTYHEHVVGKYVYKLSFVGGYFAKAKSMMGIASVY